MPRGNILVVEDDDNVRHLLVAYLTEQSELRVDSARDGADALHRVRQQNYDLVLLDVMMPHMTGIDFLDSLLAANSDPSVATLQHVPAVVVVTSASTEQIAPGQIENRFPTLVRSVLRKPVHPAELQQCLEQCLG